MPIQKHLLSSLILATYMVILSTYMVDFKQEDDGCGGGEVWTCVLSVRIKGCFFIETDVVVNILANANLFDSGRVLELILPTYKQARKHGRYDCFLKNMKPDF